MNKSLITHILITSALDRCRDAVSMWGSHQPLHEEECLLSLSGVVFVSLLLSLFTTDKATDCLSFSKIENKILQQLVCMAGGRGISYLSFIHSIFTSNKTLG